MDGMARQKKRSQRWLVIALALCLVSMVGASLIQTSGGKVTVKDMRWETAAGAQMSALLLVPDTATASNPAPAVVTSHGWYNNREMQDLNYVELARRGYVVLSIDMYGHGNSDLMPDGDYRVHGTGMYDAVLLAASLPYVDSSRIGITGHSNGARAANVTVDWDNDADEQLVASVLLVANEATYRDAETGEYYNKYGSRDVGIIAAEYDEFFFRTYNEDGSVATVPGQYIGTPNAQSFLHFGSEGTETRSDYVFYRETVDGSEALRIIYTPDQIHPWNHFSAEVVTNLLDFFEASLGAPAPIASTSQVWQWKVVFNGLGLIGLVMFMINFAILMVYTPAFASLRSKELAVAGPKPKGAGMLWFWGGLVVGTAVSALTYFGLLKWGGANRPAMFQQSPPYGIGLWAAVCGLTTIVVMVLSYLLYGRKNGFDAKASGLRIGLGKLLKTILLAVIVVTVTYGLVFVADYFFKVDYRVWVIALKAFTPDKLLIALPYLPLFLLYYIANSVAVNCFNYNGIGGKKEWVNTAILAVFNGLGPIILVCIQYIHFFATGELFFRGASFPMGAIGGIWLFPMVVILPMAAIISRKIYRVTKNPYLAGLINGTMVVIISCTNTLTQLV